MAETSTGLLRRLRDPSDADSWQRLVNLYIPLLYGWLRRYSLPHQDAEELIQEVLAVVAAEMPNFKHNHQPGAFRSWLRTILVKRLRALRRTDQARLAQRGSPTLDQIADQLEDPASNLSRLWDREHDRYIVRRLLECIEPDFQPTTWAAFQRFVLDRVDAECVARELGISVDSVYTTKYRILKRLREEVQGFMD